MGVYIRGGCYIEVEVEVEGMCCVCLLLYVCYMRNDTLHLRNVSYTSRHDAHMRGDNHCEQRESDRREFIEQC